MKAEEEDFKPTNSKRKKTTKDHDDEDDFEPTVKKSSSKKSAKNPDRSKKGNAKEEQESKPSSTKKGKVKKEEPEIVVWKWWEEEKEDDGTKWKFLQHKGPLFAPLYERLPDLINFRYDGKVVRLSEEAEECATFYGKMLDHDYTTKEVFNKNFFKDWRKTMTENEKAKIRDLSKCDFTEINTYFKKVSLATFNM